jgi:hypothetical protein
MDRIFSCNILGLDVVAKRETPCYAGKPVVYIGYPTP